VIQPALRPAQPLLEPLTGEAVLHLQGEAGVLAIGVAQVAEGQIAIASQQ